MGSSTLNAGSASDVTINASTSITIDGTAIGSIQPSRIVSTAAILDPVAQALLRVPAIPSGNSGSITINTPLLQITNGASVNVQNDGPGRAGNLRINAQSILLDNHGTITASTASGDGGNIELYLQNLLLMRHRSLLSATTSGTGSGGNTSINAPIILGLENSDIIANAIQGRGGNIKITTQGIIGLKYRDQLTSENDITASSQFGVNGTVDINTIGVDPNSGLVALPVDIVDPSQNIATGCHQGQNSSFIATGRGGIPIAPQHTLIYHQPWQDLRAIADLNPTQPLSLSQTSHRSDHRGRTPGPFQEATTWQVNAQGKPELIATRTMLPQTDEITCAK